MLKPFGKVLLGVSANLIALAAVGWVGWDTWQRGILDGYKPPKAQVAAQSAPVTRTTYNINAIIGAHLFGAANQVKQVVKQKVAPPTRLNLVLVGVIASGIDSNGLALIEVTRGKQQVIRVGQSIGKTGATLSQVATDHVLIERNGKLEKLSLKRPGLKNEKPKTLDIGQQNLAAILPSNNVTRASEPAVTATTVDTTTPSPGAPSTIGKVESGDAQPVKVGTLTLPF
ncbi:MAG: type II secretory pathway component PulC [Parasphingorhabdus sp.]|jgi:type II secretory pathway component PulC